ncbi:Photosynthetic apparatus regulatory protein RegA [Lacunisphaera limnophila]|uniref:Photosynthetic apparatus regulatory protein RegA n=1 Tax=Lacunisphaera limnophila TaxID=1838286 RepID=A0A1I7PHI9_9BACT|nr:response regulator [Lacunisphaera limnophila]AOS43072.1 Photosynthetic apparatus regulatory protein RegA [Lacunisphaera limnophila]
MSSLPPPSPGASAPAPRHLLAIDDEAPILDLLKEYLSTQGFRVSTASTAIEARRVVESDPPALIISDLQLEETDGLHLIEQLRTHLPKTPVILLTGVLFEPQVVEETLKWKVSSYVSKTAPLQVLVQEIRRLLGS